MHFWRLFTKYVDFLERRGVAGYHQCTKHLFAIYQAAQSALDAQALPMGVAVEGIAIAVFPNEEQQLELKAIVGEFRKHARTWNRMGDEQIQKMFGNRLEGFLGKVHVPGVKDTLHRLVVENVISREMLDAWTRLRNITAHGAAWESDTIQVVVTTILRVAVLIHRLIFKAIGYEGLFTDHCSEYALHYFRGRPATHDEKEIAAYFEWENDKVKEADDLFYWLQGEQKLRDELI